MKGYYSNNIIFFDAEFTDLNIKNGELISVGLVKYTGEELYVEIEYEGKVHPWVEKNVLPSLAGNPVSKEKAKQFLHEFIGNEKPYMVAYVNQFDAVYWYNLFGSPKEHPFYWIPIDFASILFACGFDPNSMMKDKFFKELGINRGEYNSHNALEDAKLLSEVYKKFENLKLNK